MAEQEFGGCSVHETLCLSPPYLVLKSEGIQEELLVLGLH